MNTQPEALRLADELEAMINKGYISAIVTLKAVAELRSLHEVNQKLVDENSKLWGWLHDLEQHIARTKELK